MLTTIEYENLHHNRSIACQIRTSEPRETRDTSKCRRSCQLQVMRPEANQQQDLRNNRPLTDHHACLT